MSEHFNALPMLIQLGWSGVKCPEALVASSSRFEFPALTHRKMSETIVISCETDVIKTTFHCLFRNQLI